MQYGFENELFRVLVFRGRNNIGVMIRPAQAVRDQVTPFIPDVSMAFGRIEEPGVPRILRRRELLIDFGHRCRLHHFGVLTIRNITMTDPVCSWRFLAAKRDPPGPASLKKQRIRPSMDSGVNCS